MEKVKVTREQAEAIEYAVKESESKSSLINYHALIKGNWSVIAVESLKTLTVGELAEAIYIGYEIEEEFKVGDWVVSKLSGNVGQVEDIKEIKHVAFSPERIIVDAIFHYPESLRHATPTEIAQEKERRWWGKHGRGVRELKEGDILINKKGGFSHVNETDTLLNSDKFKIACFKENRLDGDSK